MKLTIITNDKNKGKTSYLVNYVLHNKVNGILALSDDTKTFYSATRISDGESKVILDVNYSKKHRIGKFGIDIEAFNWANNYLKTLVDNNKETIVLDEIGQLELYKRGYYKFLAYAKKNYKGHLIISCRKEFVEKIKLFFELEDIKVLDLL